MTAPPSELPHPGNGSGPGNGPGPAPGSQVVPGPPPGPGVQPPFVAPPTDGARQRRWLAGGLVGAAALVICVGGLFGLGALVVFGSQMVVDQSRAAVTDHLTAVQHEEYAEAYEKLCDSEQARIGEDEFRRDEAAEPPIVEFTVGDPIITDDVVVPATVTYDDGTTQTLRFRLEQDTSTGEFEVCGREV